MMDGFEQLLRKCLYEKPTKEEALSLFFETEDPFRAD
jgi:hypothetical protein